MTVPDDHPHKFVKKDKFNHYWPSDQKREERKQMSEMDKIRESDPEWKGTYTAEEVQRIPAGVYKTVIWEIGAELDELIKQKEQEIEYLRLQLSVLAKVQDQAEALRYQYARGKKTE